MMSLSEGISILKKLTFKKGANILWVQGSYFLSKATKKNLHRGMPISVAIEPTTSCNLRCPECPSGLRQFTRPTGMLDETFFRQHIAELKDTLLYLTFYFQGEPYLNPSFLNMVKIAAENNIYTATSTNAHYLNDENAKNTVVSGLDRLVISIDGATQETYESYRIGGSLEKVLEGTRNVINWKRQLKSKTPYIIFQFLVVKPNEHQIQEVKQLARELGVNEVKLKTAQVYNYVQGNPLIPENKRYSRYKKNDDDTWSVKNKLENNCWRMWSSCVITWDGKIVPCCFDKDARHQLGELKEKGFSEIWHGTVYQNFRSAILRSRKEIDICTNCTEGTKVWV